MSTVQMQASLGQLESGINLASAVQNSTQESAFTSGVVSVSTVEEGLPWGDVQNAKQVMLKFLKGDPLMVGFESGVYPLRLMEPGETMLLRLDTETFSYEKSIIETVADVNGSLASRYFDMADFDGPVRAWFFLPVTSAGATITYGTPTPVMSASGVITYGVPADGDSVAVGGDTFFMASSVANSDEFSTITELKDLINNLPNIEASITGGTITVVAPPGSNGNFVNFYLGNSNTGTMTISGAGKLSGGKDASQVSIDGYTFTKIDNPTPPWPPENNEFTNISDLTALISTIPGLSASETSFVIEIIADPGSSGNDHFISLNDSSSTMSFTQFTGGHDNSVPPASDGRRMIQVNYSINSDPTAVAVSIVNAFFAESAFSSATNVGNVVTIIDALPDNREHVSPGNTRFTVSHGVQMTANIPGVFFLSKGATDVAIAIAPV